VMNKFYSAIDYGSNTALLLVVRATDDGELIEESEVCRITRLASNQHDTGTLNPEGVNKALAATDEFLAHLKKYPGKIYGVAAATSAVREEGEKGRFMSSCASILGGEPLVLSGKEEAETTFLGASSDQSRECFSVVVDIGGGSSEIGAGTPSNCVAAESLQLGCVSISQKYGLDKPYTPKDLESAAEDAEQIVKPVADRIKKSLGHEFSGNGLSLIVSGGTATTLGAYHLGLEQYDTKKVHSLEISADVVDRTLKQLCSLSITEREACAGVSEGRALVFPAGLVILSEFLRQFGSSSFRISTRGLRFGLVRQLQIGQLEPTFMLEGRL